MNKKLRNAAFKLMDVIMILTLVFGAPMNVAAAPQAQAESPVLSTDLSDYAPGEAVHLTGSGFDVGDYVLSATGPDGTADWGTVTANEDGGFESDSPALASAGTYEVSAYATGSEESAASVSFTVTAPPAPTQEPTAEPTQEPTSEPTQEPTVEPTEESTATSEPTNEPTSEPTQEPTAEPTQEPTATEPPTVTPTTEPTLLPPPNIQSDKADYAPGELVTLTGGNWQGDTGVRIIVNDDIGQSWRRDVTVTVAADGTIYDSFNLPVFFVANYSVTATGQQTGRIATTSFTDTAIGTYDQCANDDGDGYASGDTGCQWVNGNLGSNNSTYSEGDATVQRLWLNDLVPGSTHTLRLKYGTTKGGSHAYDYLTTWNYSENWITNADLCQDIDANGGPAGGECTAWGADDLFPIPADPNPAFTTNAVPQPAGRNFTMRNGDITAASVPSIASGSYAGDSETVITITFTVGSDPDACVTKSGTTTCSIVLWFGAHVALTSEWETGGGAGNISGSPYHVALDALDGAAVGQRDNQMASAAVIPNGTIVIVKDAIPNSAQDFSFNLTNSTTVNLNFLLDDDANATLPSSQSFSVPPGSYTARELNIPAGWTLTNLVCTDPSGNTSVSIPTATATINLASNETVTCTYTDTNAGRIIVDKVTNPSGDSQSFSFDAVGGSYADFSLTDAAAPNNQALAPGAYSVSETVPAGWDLTSSACVSSIGDTESPASIELDAGETVTCTFTNTKRGTIIVEKQTNPDGAAGSFTFTGTAAGTISDNGQIVVSNLVPGTYTSTENNPAPNFALTSISCNDSNSTGALGTRTATFNLEAGETVKCVFTNTQQQGTLIVEKQTDPDGDPASFTFTGTAAGSISDGQQISVNVVPGQYTSTETVPAGWDLTSIVCNDANSTGDTGTATATFNVESGETVKCTFTNQKDARIIVVKQTDPDGDSTSFEFDPSYAANFFLSDGQSNDSGDLDPGTYSVSETVPPSWDLTSAACSDSSAPDSIGLSAGETVTCTFTNTKRASIIVEKQTIPNGSSQSFEFDPSYASNFFLTDGQQNNSGLLTPGTYSVAEVNLPAGWSLTDTTCSDGSPASAIDLGAGETVTCIFTNTLSAEDLTVTKTASPSLTRTYTWGIDKSVDDTRIEIADGGTATFNYTVDVTHDDGTDSAWQVNGTINVANPNDYSVSGVSVTDAINDANASCSVTGGSSTLAANSSATFDYTCTYSAAPAASSQTNTATASWTPFGSPNASASGTANVDWGTATLTLVDDNVSVSDPLDLTSPHTFSYTDPSPSSFSYEFSTQGVAGECTDYDNTATFITDDTNTTGDDTVTVTVCVGADLTVTKTAAGTFARTYLWSIDKNVDAADVSIAAGGDYTFNYTVDVAQTGVSDGGWTLSGVITIANPNDWQAVTLSTLSDAVDNGGSCTVAAGPYTVPASGSINVNYTCSYASAPSSYAGTNTATATWDEAIYFTPTGTDSGSADFTLTQDGATNKTINVTDSYAGPLGSVTATDSAPFATARFSYSRTESGVAGTCTTYDNTATITETGQSADETVRLCVGADLTVTKTATASKDRTYKWLIDKSVDDTRIEIADGGTVTFNYTVTVTPDGFTDSGFTLGGTITITNPNDWQDVTVDVTDSLDQGGTCTITETAPYVVPANDSLVLNYTCTTDGTTTENTATATWDAATYFTPTGSASGSADVTFALDVETNKDITVVDDKTDPLNPVTLGSSNFVTGPFEFTYSLDKSGEAGTCTDYTNTAVIDETDQSDSQTVTVCVGVDLAVSKTATASKDRTYKWLIDKSVDDTEINIADGGTATFNYTVTVTPDGFTDSGFTLGGTITITNPNDWQDVTVDVTDSLDQGGTCSITETAPYIVLASDSLVLNYTCTTDGSTTENTATATWDKDDYFTPTGTASGSAPVTFALDVETNKVITVIDDKTDPLNPVTLGSSNFVTGPFEFTYALDKSGVAGTCTEYTNTAVIDETDQSASQTVTVCVGLDLTVEKTATASKDRTYLWLIDKSVDDTRIGIADGGTATFNYTVTVTPDGFTDSGFTLGGTITITNPNDWQDVTVDVTDILDQGGTCTVTGGDDVVIPADDSATLNYTCTTDGLTTENTAAATWDAATYFTPTGSASGSADVTFALDVETNKDITVIDDKTDPLNPVTLGTSNFVTGPFEFTYSLEKEGVAGTCTDYTNTAVIDETDQSASQTVTVCVGLDLKVEKTATASKDRTYKWLIDKSVDDTRIEIANGGTATFNYTVTVTPNGFTDSGFTLGGTITITNPNDWQAIAADVTDLLDQGGTCTVTGGDNVVIPADDSVTLNYTCTTDGTTTKNTATATWDAATYFTPTGTASGSADVTFALDVETNKDITVIDDKTDPGNPVELGSSNFYDGPYTFEYSLDKQGVAGTCTNYTNTAVIDETGQEAEETVTVCGGLDLTVSKTATASKDRTYKWLIDKSVDDTRIEIADGGTATFNYTVTVTPDGFTDSGYTLGGTITITNPNDWQDVTVDVTDTLDQGGTCTITETAPYVVPASDSLVLNYTCTTDGSTTENTATATWDAATYFTPTGTASGSVDVTFNLDVETNKDITVVDDKTDPLNPVTLGTSNFVTGPFEFTYSLEKEGVAGTCTDYTNTAVIDETDQSASETVTVCVGLDLTVEKTAAGTFDRTYSWSIDKNADDTQVNIAAGGSYTFTYSVDVAQTGITDNGWEVHGTITITNPNDWQDVTLDTLSDVVDNGGTCTVAAGPYTVPADDSINVNYTCSYASAPSSYAGTNTATATWDEAAYFTPTGTASGSKDFTLSQDGATNKTINVTDSFAGPLGNVTATDSAPFASKSFTYSRTVSGVAGICTEYDNTATIIETGQTADETVTLCVGAGLTVSKTANPTFTRTYLWNISKSVDKTLVEQVGGSAIFNYTVQVNQTGFTDSAWALSGVITVTNPNDWQAVTVDLTDSVDNGGSCSITNGTNVVVPASGSASRNYTCTFTSGTSGTNTATATWDAATYFTPSGSASGTAGFSFTTPTTTVNKTVTVTDTFNGTTTTLGTVTATNGAPFASKTFTYSRTVSVPASGCQSYTNTAKIVETGQTASQTITVCGPLNLGGKTIGFWQNKNGQDIIKKAGAISGVCKITPWLRQFAPFQDLSATASCTTVATYVTNVIKAANASGASMNAMLKAQMLATALDVYFSDPALGGNKIGAPAPIGGVTIDLTYIKAGSGYQNVSSAFGGATSLTVMQMLQYAAGQSNVGGSMWYGNVKSTQELAKNAFDAINNNWVFPP